MSALKRAVEAKLDSWSRQAEHDVARLIIEGKYSQIKTFTDIYGQQNCQATFIHNGKVSNGLGWIPRERAIEMYRQFKETGKIRMSW